MEYEKKDICEDCNLFGDLELEDACADSSVGYGLCCYKYVCKNECNWYCSFCFKKTQSGDIKYVCFLEYQFKKLFKIHHYNYNQFLWDNLPFKPKIQLNIIKLLNLEPIVRKDTETNYDMPKNCIRNKPIETTICTQCIQKYIPNQKTKEPLLWWGISNEEWMRRYD